MSRWFGLILIAVGLWNSTGRAQDMRVFTTIRDASAPAGQKDSEQRSLMLFHAGKIYDYIEPAQEVTVFEPAHRRFTVINLRRQLRTELTQDEIRQFLGLAEDEARRRIVNANGDSSTATKNALDLLRFLLKPEFATTFDSQKSQLSLNSPQFRYVATGVAPPSPEIVDKYLHVADWMAQFNSVLHPQSLLPSSRLKLNQEFRQRGMVPATVRLFVETDPLIQLEAKHEWTWKLHTTDRQLIDDWEKELQSSKFRNRPFRDFQQEMLKNEMAKRR